MPQHLNLIALTVRDYDEAIAFYTQKLGWSLFEDTDRGNGKRWVRVSPPGSESPESVPCFDAKGEARSPGEGRRTTHGAGLLLAKAKNDAELASVGNQTGGRVFLFLETDNLARDYAELSARGVEFTRPPTEADFGSAAVFKDLYGNLFDLIQRA